MRSVTWEEARETAMQALLDMEARRDALAEREYELLAAFRDEEDEAFEKAMRARMRDRKYEGD